MAAEDVQPAERFGGDGRRFATVGEGAVAKLNFGGVVDAVVVVRPREVVQRQYADRAGVAAGHRGVGVGVHAQPAPFVLNGLANLPIVCPSGLKDRSTLRAATAGTGPFALTAAAPGDRYTYAKRPGYTWGPAGATTATPGLPDTVVVKVVENETTAANLEKRAVLMGPAFKVNEEEAPAPAAEAAPAADKPAEAPAARMYSLGFASSDATALTGVAVTSVRVTSVGVTDAALLAAAGANAVANARGVRPARHAARLGR